MRHNGWVVRGQEMGREIAREWRRPGLSPARKRKPKNKTPIIIRQHNTRIERAPQEQERWQHTGQEDKRTEDSRRKTPQVQQWR